MACVHQGLELLVLRGPLEFRLRIREHRTVRRRTGRHSPRNLHSGLLWACEILSRPNLYHTHSLQNRFGWHWVFIPPGLAGIFIAIVVFFLISVPKDASSTTDEEAGSPARPNPAKTKALGSFASLWSIPAVPDLTIAVFGLKFVRYCMHMWLPLYLIEYLKVRSFRI